MDHMGDTEENRFVEVSTFFVVVLSLLVLVLVVVVVMLVVGCNRPKPNHPSTLPLSKCDKS
jgi:hypothetical protein